MQKQKLEEVAACIREHRSNEGSFETLVDKLEEVARKSETKGALQEDLQAIRSKADEYRKAKETGGTAWPEFEKFVSEFEKGVISSLKEVA